MHETVNYADECLQSFAANVNVVYLENLNARIGNIIIEGVVGMHGVIEKIKMDKKNDW